MNLLWWPASRWDAARWEDLKTTKGLQGQLGVSCSSGCLMLFKVKSLNSLKRHQQTLLWTFSWGQNLPAGHSAGALLWDWSCFALVAIRVSLVWLLSFYSGLIWNAITLVSLLSFCANRGVSDGSYGDSSAEQFPHIPGQHLHEEHENSGVLLPPGKRGSYIH